MAGSLFMPLSYVKAEVGNFCETRKLFAPIVCHLECRASARKPDGILPWTSD